jgi:hypothetical protein
VHDDCHRTALHEFLDADELIVTDQLVFPDLIGLQFQVAELLDEFGERGRDDELYLHLHLHGQRYDHDHTLLTVVLAGRSGRIASDYADAARPGFCRRVTDVHFLRKLKDYRLVPVVSGREAEARL